MLAAPLPVVIDNNVVLDLWLFEDLRVEPLRTALNVGRVRWVVCPSLRTELEHVTSRPWIQARGLSANRLWEQWAALAHEVSNPPTQCTGAGLTCRDVSDQKFIALALAVNASALFSWDRDLLSLRRRAARKGLRIERPDSAGMAVSGITVSV
jgi:putative PIN family toxin of toxin-antitoxin system